MSIDRVSTSAQTAYLLSQIQNAGSALDKTQGQIASGKGLEVIAFSKRAPSVVLTTSDPAHREVVLRSDVPTAATDAAK